MKKAFDCVQMMRQVREDLSKRYADKPDLMAKELREARSRFEAKLSQGKRMALAVAEERSPYGRECSQTPKKGFDCVKMMRQIRADLSKRHAGKPAAE